MEKAKKPTKTELENRLDIIRNFLKDYRKEKNTEIFTEEFENQYRRWEEIKRTGLTLNELYYCLYHSDCLLKPKSEKETEVQKDSIRKYLEEKLNYCIEKGYIIKSVDEDNKVYYERIRYALKENTCISKYITETTVIKSIRHSKKKIELNESGEMKEYCLVLEFESNERLASIAEDLSAILANSITGVTYGFYIIRIYYARERNGVIINNKFNNIEKGKF